MNAYLQPRYTLADLAANEWCRDTNALLAAYFLATRRGTAAPAPMLDQFDACLADLTAIAAGCLAVPGAAESFEATPTVTNDGDDLRHSFSGGETTVEYNIPAGNKGQLDMLGAGDILDADWAVAATDIPQHLHRFNAAMVRLTGMGLAHVVLTGVGWQYLLNNTKVQSQGGSANVVFESMQRASSGEFTAVLRAIPWITTEGKTDYGIPRKSPGVL